MKQAALLISVVAAVTLFALGCSENGTQAGGSGFIEADDAVISAETSGRVLQRNFDEGTTVAAGDTLVVIDPSQLELQLNTAVAGKSVVSAGIEAARVNVEQARIARDFAKQELDRAERLLGSGTATQRQYDQAKFENDKAGVGHEAAEADLARLKAELTRAEAEIASLERLLENCYPVVASSGVVTEKYVEVGELLAPGRPIAKVARLDTVWTKVYLPSGELAGMKLGETVKVSTESGGGEYTGTVVWTSSEAEFTPKNVQTEDARADLVYAVKVLIPNTDGNLKIGMPVFVTLED